MPHSANTQNPRPISQNDHGSKSRNPAQQVNTMNPTENQIATTTITMSAQEWAKTKTHRDFKTTVQGQQHVLRMTSLGTSLVPVMVMKGARS